MTTTPHPLLRMGTYRIEERPWFNPEPARGLTPAALARFWALLLRRHERSIESRNLRAEPGQEYAPSRIRFRYALKLEIKTLEAILELLHRILAPQALFLCDHDCTHVAAGLSATGLKRLVDSLDAYVAGNTQGPLEDLEEVNGVVAHMRRMAWGLAEGRLVEWRHSVGGLTYVLERHVPTGTPEDDFFTVTWREVDGREQQRRFDAEVPAHAFMRALR